MDYPNQDNKVQWDFNCLGQSAICHERVFVLKGNYSNTIMIGNTI
jgi:hypothetical protein